jgi:hypothetical protein
MAAPEAAALRAGAAAAEPEAALAVRPNAEASELASEASAPPPPDALPSTEPSPVAEQSSDRETSVAPSDDQFSKNYRRTFLKANPDLQGQVIVHHGVEQQAQERYPGRISDAEMQALENLRGIPTELNAELHLKLIRKEWDQFYRDHPNATREQLLRKRADIDAKYGTQFLPPAAGRPE